MQDVRHCMPRCIVVLLPQVIDKLREVHVVYFLFHHEMISIIDELSAIQMVYDRVVLFVQIIHDL